MAIRHGVKATYEEVKEEFTKRGFILLSSEYRNALTPLDYTCSCGSQSRIMLSKLKIGQSCRVCKGYKCGKYTLEQVRNIFEVRGCILLSTIYIDNNQVLDYICSCGELATIRLRTLISGHFCINCAKPKMGIGSVTEGDPSVRSGKLGQKWSKDVKFRDGNACVFCKTTDDLHAHHIENWFDAIHLRFNLDNGVTLCKTCHKEFHIEYGYKSTRVNFETKLIQMEN